MGRILLLVGGLVNAFIFVMHISFIFGIQSSDMPPHVKQVAHLYNGCVMTTVLFFAYVSLFKWRDLLNTSLGRWTCALISVFYLQRGVVEVIVRSFEPGYFALFMGLTILYAVAPLAAGRAKGHAVSQTAVDSPAGIR